MLKSLSAVAEQCLFSGDLESILATTQQAAALSANDELRMDVGNSVPRSIADTVFPCRPQWLAARDMPRRRLRSPTGKVAFFHALAHIECIAVYLAWDIVYRFNGLPDAFYRDWLRIAGEEALHFALLRNYLRQLGSDYGELPAHGGLWAHAEATANDVLARLAIVPRCMEARGLDVTPAMIADFEAMNEPEAVALLQRIYHDEVGHVACGSQWFSYVAQQRGLDPEEAFKQLILGYYNGKPKGPFNREMRIIAGFSQSEINWLEDSAHD
jgi:uncharacterized ferritin-like protein (DUF455 family)